MSQTSSWRRTRPIATITASTTPMPTIVPGPSRDLRGWLYAGPLGSQATLASAVTEVAHEVEDLHGIPIDLDVTGDRTLDAGGTALVRALREALLNAARHGAPPVSVYVEVGSELVEAFVRDHGPGFDLAEVAQDRLGVRESILGRISRHGGTAGVRRLEHGTEVSLSLPVTVVSSSVGRRPDTVCPAGQRCPARHRRPTRHRRISLMTVPATSHARSIRLVLVDDHRMFRSGVKAELDESMVIVGEAADVDAAIVVVAQTRPEVVLLDVHLPGGNGNGGSDVISGSHGVTAESGEPVRFLALSVSDAAEDVIAVIRAGERGSVTKH